MERVVGRGGETKAVYETPEERRARILADWEKYGGQPTEETTMGAIPDQYKGERDYRPNPAFGGRYMIYDKTKGGFLGENPEDARLREADDIESFIKARRPEQFIEGMKATKLPPQEVMKASPLPIGDLTEAAALMEDLPARANTPFNKPSIDGASNYKADKGFRYQMPEESESQLKAQAGIAARRQNAIDNIKRSKEFLDVLRNREKSKSKYKSGR